MDDEQMEVVEHFKYLRSLKSADGNCSKDTGFGIGMAKKILLDLLPIWRGRGINKDLKNEISSLAGVRAYCAECWILTKTDEKMIELADLRVYRRILRVSWTEHRTDQSIGSILTEFNTTRYLLGIVVRRNLSFFGHIIRDGGCELVKCPIQGKVNGK